MYKSVIMTILAMLVTAPATAAMPDQIVGVYSSLHTSEDTGDTGGMQIIVLGSNHGYYALLQCACSVLDPPLLVRVEVDEAAGTLTFAAHDDPDNECPTEAFTASFEAKGLRVHYADGYDPGLLQFGRGITP